MYYNTTKNIIVISWKRDDGLHTKFNSEIESNDITKIFYHSSCVSSYTSNQHIERRKRKLSLERPIADTSMPSPTKITRRSEVTSFDFRKNCLFCGEDCVVTPSDKNPSRWYMIRHVH